MENFKKMLLDPNVSVIDSMKIVTDLGSQFAAIVDENEILLGVISDADFRKAVLNKISMDAPVSEIMNREPKVAKSNFSKKQILKIVQSFGISHVPVIDENRKVLSILNIKDLIEEKVKQNPVVIMAGGLGARLGELTANCPKPLLKVGEKPILEIILENFIEHGFRNFYISVNYKSEMIETYFGDGSNWNVSINYLKEDIKLGTAGALSLLNVETTLPLLVMNGDILTKVNFSKLLDFHQKQNAEATMCVRSYDIQIPFGVIEANGDNLVKVIEKPVHEFFVNAGVYVINSSQLGAIKKNIYLDMPSLFSSILQSQKEIKVFPIHEYWLDIGRVEDFEKAQFDFYNIFKGISNEY